MSEKPTHAYKGVAVIGDDGKRCLYCGLHRSAHPEPAPESEDHAMYPRDAVRAAYDHGYRDGLAARPEPATPPPDPEPLRNLAEEWLRITGRSPKFGPLTFGQDVDSLTRLLERVVRQAARRGCAQCCAYMAGTPEHATSDCAGYGILEEFGLSPESAPESKP